MSVLPIRKRAKVKRQGKSKRQRKRKRKTIFSLIYRVREIERTGDEIKRMISPFNPLCQECQQEREK